MLKMFYMSLITGEMSEKKEEASFGCLRNFMVHLEVPQRENL